MAREESFFDELARGLADGSVTRAKALRLMGGALVGAALASVPGVAWANDRCSQGQTRCGDRCVNLQTNERHCGSCRNRCASKQTCCNGRCVNLQQNENHCGSCSNHCAAGEECVGGVCQGGGCPGTTLTEGDCNCAFTCDARGAPQFICQGNPDCTCLQTTEGSGFCGGTGACAQDACSSSTECPPGWVCAAVTCCDHPICIPPCSSSPTTSSAQRHSATRANGLIQDGRSSG
jgi:Stigma-specific protein, Stig1